MEVVGVLPLAQLVGKQLGVVDDDTVEQAVELLGIDAVRALTTLPFRRGVAGVM